MSDERPPRRDDPAAVGIALLAANGFPRIPATVLMTLMLTESGEATADELAAATGVSPAAISGAVRYLQVLGMLRRHQVPGSRRYVYELPEQPWYTGSVKTDLYTAIARFAESSAEVLEGAPRDRMADMAGFFRYLEQRMPVLLDEWHAGRAAGLGGSAAEPN
jgi:DNA-binding transcriptional regulator GbsR (MarR family)